MCIITLITLINNLANIKKIMAMQIIFSFTQLYMYLAKDQVVNTKTKH